MCGIVGYIGKRKAQNILLEGLKSLEYRGYDSAGIAIFHQGRIEIKRCKGKLKELEGLLKEEYFGGKAGIGHTRWATHGKPSENNAHPHKAGNIVVVHNGIIENYLNLKERLISQGHHFKSETDSEIISHLIESFIKEGKIFEEAVRSALKELQGSYAIAVLNEKEPDKLIGARKESPLVIGLGEKENFLASDIPAILKHTKRMVFLEDEEMVTLTSQKVQITTLEGKEIQREPKLIPWDPVMAEKGGYKHFMLKEIFEQPRAIIDTIKGRIAESKGEIYLEELGISRKELKKIRRIFLVACGTSWHAALVGKFMIEEFCQLPVEVDLASEFRYRNPVIDKDNLLVLISQSGETADTLAALREGKKKGTKTLAICNVVDSTLARDSLGVIYTRAGPEIGVASTKAFSSQLVALYLLALYLARITNKITSATVRKLLKELVKIPGKLEEVLSQQKAIEKVAKKYAHSRDFLYLARGINYPIALEGALKLKEISYIHAEGYPAGEMKHGPIALIDEEMPVVVLVTKNNTYSKILSNIEEVRARGGKIIAITTEREEKLSQKANDLILVPSSPSTLAPLLLTLPLQLFAYHIAVLRGTDVDQPRNLAKSVTVE